VNYTPKGSKGRDTHATGRKVADVETLQCPTGGLHVLVNDRAGRTACAGCLVGWAALDQSARTGGGSRRIERADKVRQHPAGSHPQSLLDNERG